MSVITVRDAFRQLARPREIRATKTGIRSPELISVWTVVFNRVPRKVHGFLTSYDQEHTGWVSGKYAVSDCQSKGKVEQNLHKAWT